MKSFLDVVFRGGMGHFGWKPAQAPGSPWREVLKLKDWKPPVRAEESMTSTPYSLWLLRYRVTATIRSTTVTTPAASPEYKATSLLLSTPWKGSQTHTHTHAWVCEALFPPHCWMHLIREPAGIFCCTQPKSCDTKKHQLNWSRESFPQEAGLPWIG